MLYLWIVIGGWVYAVCTTLCYRKLSRRFGNWQKVWRIVISLFWPAWSLFWAMNHSITKAVDGIEKVLEGDFSIPKTKSERNLDIKNIPD